MNWTYKGSFLALILLITTSSSAQKKESTVPVMTNETPTAGVRVREQAFEYKGTKVHHSLYLPTDWKPGKQYPVIVEYTGNYYPPSGSSGLVQDANLGYALTGGKGFIWVVMPYIAPDLTQNERTWWGDKQATLDYCKINLPRICERYGGNMRNIFLCGFSRGAIAVNYIGLADDEIARFWKGFIAHEHYDGIKTWGYEQDDRAAALIRLQRLEGRPQLITEAASFGLLGKAKTYLNQHDELGQFTFLTVPVASLFDIPTEIPSTHTDLGFIKKSRARKKARRWLRKQLRRN